MTYELLIDLHKGNPRQGPGSDEHTMQALRLTGIMDSVQLEKYVRSGGTMKAHRFCRLPQSPTYFVDLCQPASPGQGIRY